MGAERAEFIFFWLRDCLEAIRALAGEIVERAVYYPEDDQFLLRSDADRGPLGGGGVRGGWVKA
ncbi:MAG: hypothetical protein ACRDKF_02480 [Actinomycetota bacterium]